jgi:Leucine-rich repeat (LRR) protein
VSPSLTPVDGRLDLRLVDEDQLPGELFDVPSLRELNIVAPKLTGIPDAVGNLRALESVQIQALALRDVSAALFQLPGLERLIIRDAAALVLPSALSNVAPLEELRITGANLAEIPLWFTKFKSTMRILDLSHNKITEIGSIFARYNALRELDLAYNAFSPETSFEDLFFGISGAQTRTLKKVRLLPNNVDEKALRSLWNGPLS